MTSLQLRLQEAVMEDAIQPQSAEEILFVKIRQLEALKKNVEDELKGLKEEAKELTKDGVVIGVDQIGYYTFSEAKTEKFDHKGAMKAGLINQRGEWAEFWKTETTERFVFKKYEEKNV